MKNLFIKFKMLYILLCMALFISSSLQISAADEVSRNWSQQRLEDWPVGMVYKYNPQNGIRVNDKYEIGDDEKYYPTKIPWTRLTKNNKPGPNKKYVVIAHGNRNCLAYDGTGLWIEKMAQAFYSQGIDVLAIDWGNCAMAYGGLRAPGTSEFIPEVARRAGHILFGSGTLKSANTLYAAIFNDNGSAPLPGTGNKIDFINDNNCKAEFVGMELKASNGHFIGHSHGAHVCGNIAYLKGEKFNRLTLLDASPQFGGHYWGVGSLELFGEETLKWLGANFAKEPDARGHAKFVEFYKSSRMMSISQPLGHFNVLLGKDIKSPDDYNVWDAATRNLYDGYQKNMTHGPSMDHRYAYKWYTATVKNGGDYNLGYKCWDNGSYNKKFLLLFNKDENGIEKMPDTIDQIKFSRSPETNSGNELLFSGVIQTSDYNITSENDPPIDSCKLDVIQDWLTKDVYKTYRNKTYPKYKNGLQYLGGYTDLADAVIKHIRMVDISLSAQKISQDIQKDNSIKVNLSITGKNNLNNSISKLIAVKLTDFLMGEGPRTDIEPEVNITFEIDKIENRYGSDDDRSYLDSSLKEGWPTSTDKEGWPVSLNISKKEKLSNLSKKTIDIVIPQSILNKDPVKKYIDEQGETAKFYLRAKVTSVQDVKRKNEELTDVYLPNGQAAVVIKISQERYAVACNDNSGSMEYYDPNGQRKNALARFLDKLNSNFDKAAIVNFESSVTSSTGFEEPKSLKSRIQIRNGGGTDIAAAINKGINMLQSVAGKIKNNAAIYVLTDGENNAGDAPVINAISKAGSLGIRVHYGHFGGSVFGASDLEPATVNLASSDNDVELASSYNTIAEAVIATGGIYGEIRTADDIEPFVDLIFSSGLTMDDPSDKSTVPGQMRIYDIMYEGQEEVEYWFTGREKEEIGITVTGIDYYPEITLFDEDENQLEEDLNEDGNKVAEITTTLPYTGMYKVRIKAKNGGYGLYNIFVDVANAVVENVTDYVTTSFSSWKVDPNTGALVGDLVLHNNDDSPKLLQKSFWYALPEGDSLKLANADGTNSDGIPYMDITQLVEAQLPNIGNGDLVLDPGETVVISGITVYSKDRNIPQGQLYAIWADPPKAKITLPKLNAALSKDGSTVSISWESLEVESAASASYIVEESDSLAHPNWNPVLTGTVKQDQKEVLVVPASNGTKFYRLRQK